MMRRTLLLVAITACSTAPAFAQQPAMVAAHAQAHASQSTQVAAARKPLGPIGRALDSLLLEAKQQQAAARGQDVAAAASVATPPDRAAATGTTGVDATIDVAATTIEPFAVH